MKTLQLNQELWLSLQIHETPWNQLILAMISRAWTLLIMFEYHGVGFLPYLLWYSVCQLFSTVWIQLFRVVPRKHFCIWIEPVTFGSLLAMLASDKTLKDDWRIKNLLILPEVRFSILSPQWVSWLELLSFTEASSIILYEPAALLV